MRGASAVLLVDFAAAGSIAAWEPVNDLVMGGVSSGALVATAGGAAFTGQVALAHGGGFASVRCGPRDWPTAGATALRLSVRGDGRRYRLTLRTDARGDGIQYQAGFAAGIDWHQVVLPLGAFAARWRGRPVAAAPVLEPGRIRTIGLLIAERQAGPFRLELERLEALED